jgi:hypothetical protein
MIGAFNRLSRRCVGRLSLDSAGDEWRLSLGSAGDMWGLSLHSAGDMWGDFH